MPQVLPNLMNNIVMPAMHWMLGMSLAGLALGEATSRYSHGEHAWVGRATHWALWAGIGSFAMTILGVIGII